jgi:hypothetical protein
LIANHQLISLGPVVHTANHLQCFRWAEFSAFSSEALYYHHRIGQCQLPIVKIVRIFVKIARLAATGVENLSALAASTNRDIKPKLSIKSAVSPLFTGVICY